MAVAESGKQLGAAAAVAGIVSTSTERAAKASCPIYFDNMWAAVYMIYTTRVSVESAISRFLIDEFFVMLYNLAGVYSQSFSQHIGSSTLKNIK